MRARTVGLTMFERVWDSSLGVRTYRVSLDREGRPSVGRRRGEGSQTWNVWTALIKKRALKRRQTPTNIVPTRLEIPLCVFNARSFFL
jgi:hypothetical protein